MSGTVLCLGASGKIARHAAPVFKAAGWQVRMYDRRQGDMAAQARGADVIVNGLNPPNYHDWRRIVPAITREVIAAAQASGATVIVPGNVYVHGDTPGLWTEDTPHRPVSRKGRIREEMEQAYRASGVRTILLRAGDFISGQPGDTDVMGLIHLRQLARGRVVAPGNPDALHAYGYLPDWAQAARLLADRRATLPAFAEVNLGGANFTTRQLCDSLSARLNRPLRLAAFPWTALRLLSPVWELARELQEMRYLWQVSHGLVQDRLMGWVPDYRPTDLSKIMLAGLGAAFR
ncbi:epimerase [Gemmobacter sp.]|uniref:epimerase n=1 Tax=Gemmobacter sp. TaxID=1898957 RepID=UPI002B000B08|nr:epimerase [Gemmobacter sp.]